MRVRDPIGGPPDLQRFFDAYERHFRKLPGYLHHLRWLVARYSYGDGPAAMRRAFSFALGKLVAADRDSCARYGTDKRIFLHRGHLGGVFRDNLVFLAFGLCLKVPGAEIAALLGCCERGDPLIEAIARAAGAAPAFAAEPPRFRSCYEELYQAVEALPQGRPTCIRAYLDVWYSDRMKNFPFKDEHKLTGQPDYVGYWCFEAAGLVAALGIDDATFSQHPHFPRDLAAWGMARGNRRAVTTSVRD